MNKPQVRVCKFGGSSLADADKVNRCAFIALADERRRFIVVSAPGKSGRHPEKITDTLIAVHSNFKHNMKESEGKWALFCDRFHEIASGMQILDTEFNLKDELSFIRTDRRFGHNYDWLVSRGEYIMAKILAHTLGWTFIDPVDFLEINNDNEVVLDKCFFDFPERAVIAGFYGRGPKGVIKALSRGGSDTSGAVVAYMLSHDNEVLYENWTDTDGLRVIDPKIVPAAQLIKKATFTTIGELSNGGASVFHHSAIEPLRAGGVPCVIKNANNTTHCGTRLVPDEEGSEKRSVIGIAGRSGITEVSISFDGLSEKSGIVAYVTSIFNLIGGIEDIYTGGNTITIIAKTKKVLKMEDKIHQKMLSRYPKARINISHNRATVCIVGSEMRNTPGVFADFTRVLSEAGVNIIFGGQTGSEHSITCGIKWRDMNKAMKALYATYFTEQGSDQVLLQE